MKKTTLLTFVQCAIFALAVHAQDTTWLDFRGKTTPDKATMYAIKTRTDSGWLVNQYRSSDSVRWTTNYKDDSLKIKEGTYTAYYSNGLPSYRCVYAGNKIWGSETHYYNNGQVWAAGQRRDGHYDGEWVGYFRSGKFAGKATYFQGKQISGTFYNEDGAPDEGVTEFFQEAEYPGGMSDYLNFINKTIKYPKDAFRNNIQGTVIVQFIVGKDGDVTDLQVSTHIYKSLDEEALRVLGKMSRWKPAMICGVPTKSYKKQPIAFRL